ncbi:MAG TPA: hypothetical protein VE983_04775 [Solirubrobacteraceae bacterium]|nr:hypothetical protein [Solirubrobacteraceae bacterium]
MTLLAAPALPLHTAGKYVAGAYIVFVVMLVVYLGIMTLRTRRTRRELSELRREVLERQAQAELDGPGLAPRSAEQPARVDPGRAAASPERGSASSEREAAV